MGHGDRFLVPYLLFMKSTVWDKEPVPVSHPYPVSIRAALSDKKEKNRILRIRFSF